MSVTGTFQGQIIISDSSVDAGSPVIPIPVNGSFVGTNLGLVNTLTIGTSPVTIALPISPLEFVYIKNLSVTQVITVTWTPTGGASASVIALRPGAFICFAEPNTTSGITALSVLSSATGGSITYMILG